MFERRPPPSEVPEKGLRPLSDYFTLPFIPVVSPPREARGLMAGCGPCAESMRSLKAGMDRRTPQSSCVPYELVALTGDLVDPSDGNHPPSRNPDEFSGFRHIKEMPVIGEVPNQGLT